jgi:hypothetical protein
MTNPFSSQGVRIFSEIECQLCPENRSVSGSSQSSRSGLGPTISFMPVRKRHDGRGVPIEARSIAGMENESLPTSIGAQGIVGPRPDLRGWRAVLRDVRCMRQVERVGAIERRIVWIKWQGHVAHGRSRSHAGQNVSLCVMTLTRPNDESPRPPKAQSCRRENRPIARRRCR